MMALRVQKEITNVLLAFTEVPVDWMDEEAVVVAENLELLESCIEKLLPAIPFG